MNRETRVHRYKITTEWTGNQGEGTSHWRNFGKGHRIVVDGKSNIEISSYTMTSENSSEHSDEELLLAEFSSCHMLWYLHLCASVGVIITSYTDVATSRVVEDHKSKEIKEVVLQPVVSVKYYGMMERAKALHQIARKMCLASIPCNFPVELSITINWDDQMNEVAFESRLDNSTNHIQKE